MKQFGQVGSEETLQTVTKRLDLVGHRLTTIYSYTEAARALGVHPQTIRNWVVGGQATPCCVGAISKRLYLDQAEVDRLRTEVVNAGE